jgi:DNA-directed RNA polymerase subunit RPC12/RpoP
MTATVYTCSRCEQATPTGEGTAHDGGQVCPCCAEIVLFWETIEHDDGGDE